MHLLIIFPLIRDHFLQTFDVFCEIVFIIYSFYFSYDVNIVHTYFHENGHPLIKVYLAVFSSGLI